MRLRGAALQCRITTEDPTNGFRPDTGRITTYRSPGGGGVRLDGGTTYTGAEISAHFDSMLAKLTCRGRTFEDAVRKARRAVTEFRIRGVATNIPFLIALLDEPDFRAGRLNTSFIEDHPDLLKARPERRPRHPAAHLAGRGDGQQAARRGAGERRPGRASCPTSTSSVPAPDGSRQALLRLGPEAFAADAARAAAGRASPTPPSATPTSPCSPPGCAPATCSRSAGHVSRMTPELLSLEAWGGATYDVALRFLSEDPWDRLAQLRQAVPNICLQMLLRGRNTVGYTPYPTEVTNAFVAGGRRDRHRHLPHLRRPQRRRADAPGDRGRARDRHARSRRSPSATPATCPAPTRSSTRSTTTSASPSGSSTPARTCSRSRTWRACCAPRPPAPW